MKDLLFIETGDGGSIVKRGNDFAKVEGLENAPYLAMFGGRRWWGNYLRPNNKWASKTETALLNNALNSAGRVAIEAAVNEDLAFLKEIEGTTVTVTTVIAGPKRLDIIINVNGQPFIYRWNPDTMYLTYVV
jgi:hypothetical protein